MKRAVALLACLLIALTPATALAKKKHKKVPKLGGVVTMRVTGNTAATQGAESTATATCPAGKQAVGGGFQSPLHNNSAVIVHSSYRSGANAWTVAGQVAEGAGAVTAEVFCRNASAGPVTDVTASTTLSSSGEIKTLTASCRAGTRLIGGGFQSAVPPAGDAVVFPQVNQTNSPNAWTVTGVENQDGLITLTAHAYCMSKIAAPVLLLSQTDPGNGGIFAAATAVTPSCPIPKKPKKGKKHKKRKKRPRKLLSGGGFSASPINGVTGAPVLIFGVNRTNGIGWAAGAVNGVTSPGPFTVTSQAICL